MMPTLQTYARAGQLVRRFTEAEDDLILALSGEGLNGNQIGRRLGRTAPSITARLDFLSRLEGLEG